MGEFEFFSLTIILIVTLGMISGYITFVKKSSKKQLIMSDKTVNLYKYKKQYKSSIFEKIHNNYLSEISLLEDNKRYKQEELHRIKLLNLFESVKKLPEEILNEFYNLLVEEDEASFIYFESESFKQKEKEYLDKPEILASIYATKANIYYLQLRHKKAKAYYKKSLKQYKNPDTLFAYGYFAQNQDMIKVSTKLYEEALEIYRDLSLKNKNLYLPYVATILNGLAVLNKKRDNLTLAKMQSDEALEIYRTLTIKNINFIH